MFRIGAVMINEKDYDITAVGICIGFVQ